VEIRKLTKGVFVLSLIGMLIGVSIKHINQYLRLILIILPFIIAGLGASIDNK